MNMSQVLMWSVNGGIEYCSIKFIVQYCTSVKDLILQTISEES